MKLKLVRKMKMLLFIIGGDYETGRFNEGDRDLNRDFPTWRYVNSSIDNIYLNRQPETKVTP